MSKCKLVLGLTACLGIGLLVSRTLSQTRGGFGGGGGFGRPRTGSRGSSGSSTSVRTEETDQSKKDSLKGAVGATDEQWVLIKSKLERVKQLRQEACFRLGVGGGGGGGSSQSHSVTSPGARVRGGAAGASGSYAGPRSRGTTNQRNTQSHNWMQWKLSSPWEQRGAQSQDEKLCDELFEMLRSKRGSPAEIKQKMDELSRARNEAQKEFAAAQQELRRILTLEQECRLVALGWLD